MEIFRKICLRESWKKGEEKTMVKDIIRKEVVIKSIDILRSHEKTDEEIKSMMLKDFSINDKVIEELLKAEKK